MGAALEGGFELGALALCFVALALLVAAKELAQAIAAPFNVSIFGSHPFRSIATAIENGIVGTLDDAIRGVEKTAAGFESGLIDAFGLLIAIPLLIGLGIKAALEYMWNEALMPRIHSVTNAIKTAADAALARVATLEGTVVANLGAAERYARDHAASALASAEAFVEHRLTAAVDTLRGDIAAGVSQAERYADEAVGKLRGAEDAAIAGAVGLAVAAKVAGEQAAAAALNEAERVAGSALAQSEAAAAEALARAQAAGQAALDGVKGIAVGVGDDLATIEGAFGAAGVGALVGSIPAIATLVAAIATEAGLENAACRSKVKGICGTDTPSWEKLLAGALLIGVPLSLAELVPVGKAVIGELSTLMQDFA